MKLFVIIIVIIVILVITLGCIAIYRHTGCSFYHCNKYNPGVLFNNKLQQCKRATSPRQAEIYIPCGYTNVEQDLQEYSPPTPNQIVFAVDGCDQIVSKNWLWKTLQQEYGRTGAAKLVPETFIVPSDTSLALQIFDNQQIYILKKNVQRQQGILLTRDPADIRAASQNGYVVVQKYVMNPLLFDRRKFDVRIYLLIVKKDGRMWYWRHSGGRCHYTSVDYNTSTLDRAVHIPSGYTEDQSFKAAHPETLADLRTFSLRSKDMFNALDILLQRCCKAFDRVLGKDVRYTKNVQCQLFGLDILFDANYKPWLIEINKGPEMDWSSDREKSYKEQIVQDLFRLARGQDDHDCTLVHVSEK